MAELKSKVAKLESEREHLATKGDIANLYTALAQMENRLIRWIVFTVIGTVIGTVIPTGIALAALILMK